MHVQGFANALFVWFLPPLSLCLFSLDRQKAFQVPLHPGVFQTTSVL
jgi:hypothetical protein